MDPSCLVSTVQAGVGGVMVWGIQYRIYEYVSNRTESNRIEILG